VALEGELDMATVPVLEEHLVTIEHDSTRALVLDLRDLKFVDSSGLHAFLNASRRAVENGHRFAIVGVSESTRRLFDITNTTRLLDEPEAFFLIERFTAAERRPDRGTGGA
jgi:anti-sigma B factor antagonist